MLAIAIAIAIAIGAAVAAGCGPDTEPGADLAARDRAIESLAGRLGNTLLAPPLHQSLDELLPNVRFNVDSGSPSSLVDSVVVGEIDDATPGRSQIMLEEPDGPLAMVDFEDIRAMVRTVHLSVDVDEEIGSDVVGDRITVGLVIPAEVDPEVTMRGLESMGPVVLFLRDDSVVFDYDDALYSIVGNGTFLGLIGNSGEIDFPVIRRTESSSMPETMFAGVTLDTLREAASGPERVIPMTTPSGGGFPQRSGP